MKRQTISQRAYITILFLNIGQLRVNVSYSPPSPQILQPYFSFYINYQIKYRFKGKITLGPLRSNDTYGSQD